MYSEITEQLFYLLVPTDTECASVQANEHDHRIRYHVRGVEVMRVNSYLTGTFQYFVKDINS